jgi:asparagine synthase (glutamine-hydrolysing)
MCGIAGFVNTSPYSGSERVLEAMNEQIRHRGPDGSGFFRDDYAFLGHRRLSIIDLVGGKQPMSNEDESLWITYNGEIFNHAQLRPALEQAGHIYQSKCDTETILHAFEQYGPECVTRFRGMFSFAIWDQHRRELFCARDRLGIKPFYYFWDGSVFAFASEIKALLAHPAISPGLNKDLLAEYLAFGYVSGERTLFPGIKKLMAGHYLRMQITDSGASLDIARYWDVPAPQQSQVRSDAEWIRECRERLEETVGMRLMSDVPLGMFLSGGVDSSAIAALMKRMVSTPVKTFAVGYEEAQYSELEFARQVAGRIGTEHHEVTLGMTDFFNALPELIWHEDEPITWPSSVSLNFVSRLAAREVKVVLTGEGSDELFAGYSRYHFYQLNQRWMGAYGLLPDAARRSIREHIRTSSLLSAPLRRRLGHTFLGRGENIESLYLDNFYSAFCAAEQRSLFPNVVAESAYAAFLSYYDTPSARPLLSRLLYADQKTYLVELLMKQDQMSMACSIESRVPFLDHPFVEFAAQVPDSLKIRGGVGKYILKKAVEDLLPSEITYRKKMGFPTPLRQWLLDHRAQPLYSLLGSSDGLLASLVDSEALANLIHGHRSGLHDATERIWRLLNLQLWGEVFLLGRREEWREDLLPGPAASPTR